MKYASRLGRILLLILASSAAGTGLAQTYLPSNNAGKPNTDPTYRAKIHTELGSMYFQAGAAALALDEFGIALNADSSYVQAYSIRGLVHASLKEYAKADADFRRALDLAPNDPEVNNNYGWYLCDTGKPRESIRYFMQAIKSPLYETPDRAYANAGACALKADDLDGAQAYLLKAIQMSRDGAAQSRLQMAHLLFRRVNLDEARIYLNDALRQMEPPSPDALWLGIRIERRLGNRAAEAGYAAQLRSRYPASEQYQEFLKGKFE